LSNEQVGGIESRMMSLQTLEATARSLATRGVAFAGPIVEAAAKHNLDPALLAAVAAQETGGPQSNGGRNILGDGGHGHGVFQIDDRWHDFARTSAAMDPTANADYAAGMLSGLLHTYGGNVHRALSAYNAGSPNATGTVTDWGRGRRLGYADSVLAHYRRLSGDELSADARETVASVNTLASFAATQLPQPATSTAATAHRHDKQPNAPEFASLIFNT
jgi:soluble lytic murein transglycosylase-like protein